MTQIQMTKTKVFNFGKWNLDLFSASDFEFRIWNFAIRNIGNGEINN